MPPTPDLHFDVADRVRGRPRVWAALGWAVLGGGALIVLGVVIGDPAFVIGPLVWLAALAVAVSFRSWDKQRQRGARLATSPVGTRYCEPATLLDQPTAGQLAAGTEESPRPGVLRVGSYGIRYAQYDDRLVAAAFLARFDLTWGQIADVSLTGPPDGVAEIIVRTRIGQRYRLRVGHGAQLQFAIDQSITTLPEAGSR